MQTNATDLKYISPLHPALMALQYPLLFPYGDKGFHTGIKYRDTDGTPGIRENVSMLEYHCYQCHYRKDEPNPYTCCGRLSDQLLVNYFSCVEASRLSFIFFNQDKLRCESYQRIDEAIAQGIDTGRDIGIQKILPSSFTGGRRYMTQNYHDAMAICRVHGAPDLFTTFTCNPKWPEITEELRMEPGQHPCDRADIITQVYHMKLQEFYVDVKDGSAFGPVRAGMFFTCYMFLTFPIHSFLYWCLGKILIGL